MNVDTVILCAVINNVCDNSTRALPIAKNTIYLDRQRIEFDNGVVSIPARQIKFRAYSFPSLLKMLREERIYFTDNEISLIAHRYNKKVN